MFISIIYQMEQSSSHSLSLRPRFRSTKYSVSRKTSLSRPEQQTNQTRNSIINIRKLNSVLRQRDTNKSMTIALGSKQDMCLKTFTSFVSREYPRQYFDETKQNMKFKVLLPEYDQIFDEKDSQFTLLDVLAKPLRYNTLAYSEKELKRQRNEIQLISFQINALKNTIHSKIDSIKTFASNKFQGLKDALSHQEVEENERKMRNRKELGILNRCHQLDVRISNKLKDRNLDLQQIIFNCHPLQLQYRRNSVLQIDQTQYL